LTNHLAISRNYWFIKMFCLLYIQNKILLGDRKQQLFDEYIQDLINKALLDSRDSCELLPYVDARRRLCVRSSNIVTFFLNPPWNELANMNWSCAEIYMLFWNCIRVRFSLFLESLFSLLNNYRVNQNTPTFENIVRGQIDGHICAILSAWVFSGVRVTRSLVLCVCFLDLSLSFCPFSIGHCVVCSSSIYGFWLPFIVFKLFFFVLFCLAIVSSVLPITVLVSSNSSYIYSP